jgi:hypothetical protein
MKIPVKTYADVNLLQREYHNKEKFDVIFERNTQYDIYVIQAGKALGPARAVCKSDDFLYLPHAYYSLTGVGVPIGTPMTVLINLEHNMYKGNKLPSNQYGLNE